jgi:alpha 1,3-glucosidase
MHYNEKFEEFGYPADVFWLDISHTEGSMYFAFDRKKFSNKAIKLMNDVIDYSERRLVVITDPHIKKDMNYPVFE